LYDHVHLGEFPRPTTLSDGHLFFERLSDCGPKIALTAGAPTRVSTLAGLEARVLRRLAVANLVVFTGTTRGLAFHHSALRRARADLQVDGAGRSSLWPPATSSKV
jgi:hypothetical protein